jgi:hypothetical protein
MKIYMLNGITGSIWDVENQDWIRADTNKVTEQDIKRTQWEWKQAKKVQEQIKKKQIENNNIANFLSFLLKEIKNEEIISAIYNTFFKVIDQKTKISYLRKSINNIVLIWFFAPFFPNELKKFQVHTYFQYIWNIKNSNQNLNEYILYIKNLSKKYHDNVPISQSALINLLVLIIWEFKLSKETLDKDWKNKIKNELLSRLK